MPDNVQRLTIAHTGGVRTVLQPHNDLTPSDLKFQVSSVSLGIVVSLMTASFTLAKAYFVALFCEAILHGMYTILTGGALYLLLRKRRHQRKSPANLTMILVTVLMYMLSTVHVGLSLQQNLIAFFNQHAADGGLTILNDQGNSLVYSQIALEVVNCLIGDSIVCWRTWVLWGRDTRIIIFLILCILGGTAAGIGVVRAFARSPPGLEVYNAEITTWFEVFGGLTCAANLYAVAVIAFKSWRSMQARRSLGSNVVIYGGRYFHALLLLVESGLLYCVALIIVIVLFSVGNNGVYVITDMLSHLTGIYPTLIIVLVTLQLTLHDDITQTDKALSTLRCASDPEPDNTRRRTPRLGWRRGGGHTINTDTTGSFALQPVQIFSDTTQESWNDQESLGTTTNERSLRSDERLKKSEIELV